MLRDVRITLMSKRDTDGMWRGSLSSSAISTSVSVFALHTINHEAYKAEIERGAQWLLSTMKPDGSWGDSVESPSNMTATLLAYNSLYALGMAPESSFRYVMERFGAPTAQLSDAKTSDIIARGVLKYYGSDLTFSVPILSVCALSGVIDSWRLIPPFPFELAVLPQSTFRFLNLPVVSYAIPALIAIGILQLRMKHSTTSLTARLREPFVRSTLRKLTVLQPDGGGFLEAAPLTAFVSACLSAAGYRDHVVVQRSADFLVRTQRADGAWPIDTDLAGWCTSLAGNALGDDLIDCTDLADIIRSNATKQKHPFTGAAPGGWGWTNLSGSVPDGDDTSGALVALHTLTHGTFSPEVAHGLEWLMGLQNRDGGMPTFCKGWGKLPFDRSSPDISAHAALAMGLWMPVLPEPLKVRVGKSYDRLLGWLEAASARQTGKHCGWTPLWFGDQDAHDEKSPVYGTATLMEYLYRLDDAKAHRLADAGIQFLLHSQNDDGGWGGQRGCQSKVTLTAKAIAALAAVKEADGAVARAVEYLYSHYRAGTLYRREPIGLYFARLWYSEELYNLCYLTVALKRLQKEHKSTVFAQQY